MLDFPTWQPHQVGMQEEAPPRHPASEPAAGGGGAPAAGGGDAPGPAPGLEALPGLAAPTYTGPPAAGAPMPAAAPAVPPPAGPAPDEQWIGHGGERWEWWPYGSRSPDGRWYLWVEGVGWQAR